MDPISADQEVWPEPKVKTFWIKEKVKTFFFENRKKLFLLGSVFLGMGVAAAGLWLPGGDSRSSSVAKPGSGPISGFKRLIGLGKKGPIPTLTPTLFPVPSLSPTMPPVPTLEPILTPTPSPRKFTPVVEGVDLDVIFIERTPRYSMYQVCYDPSGFNPSLCGNQDQQRWPQKGETVTFRAHVLNKGTKNTGIFGYEWFIDGIEVESETHPGLAPGEEGLVEYPWVWDHEVEGERLLGEHKIEFEVDPDNQVAEASENNNSLVERTDALNFRIFFSEEQYDALNAVVNRIGSFSAEDWIQDQFEAMRDRFKKADYPLTPNGIREVIRIDKIVVTPNDQLRHLMEADPDKGRIDGAWQFYCPPGEIVECQGQKYNCDTEPAGHAGCYAQLFQVETDWGLIHELAHQLGIIDLYRMNTANVPDPVNGNEVNGESRGFDYPGLMGGGDTRPHQDDTFYSSHTAYAFNLHKGFRRGFYGDYLFDLPSRNFLEIKDREGNPVAGAKIEVFQKDEEEIIRFPPKFTGTTNPAGIFELPNQDAGWGPTKTGHILRSNPFGPVNVVGTQGLFLIKVDTGAEIDYLFLDQTLFNLAYWSGNKESATYTLQFAPDF